MIPMKDIWHILQKSPIDYSILYPGMTIADLVIRSLNDAGMECDDLERIAKESRRGESQRVRTFERQAQGGLRKCPGHKIEAKYRDKNGVQQCCICGGYKY